MMKRKSLPSTGAPGFLFVIHGRSLVLAIFWVSKAMGVKNMKLKPLQMPFLACFSMFWPVLAISFALQAVKKWVIFQKSLLCPVTDEPFISISSHRRAGMDVGDPRDLAKRDWANQAAD